MPNVSEKEAAIGIDVGGTFTDFTLWNETTQSLDNFKVPSTPHDPSEAIELGLRNAMDHFGMGRKISHLGHGTTVATNMVIERRGSKTALITTKGFRDILEIGRQTRPDLYDITVNKPNPLVPRYLRYEVNERISSEGNILTELNLDEIKNIAKELMAEDIEAVAICFLHAYRFPEHELNVRQILRSILPASIPICLSSQILPEFREFERFSTTVMNSYLQPKMGRYMERLVDRIHTIGLEARPYTIHSNGGLMSIEDAKSFPVQTCLSGPAAGVVGASRLIHTANLTNVITFDVGGTSTDVSLIKDGVPAFTTNREVAGYPVKCPMVDVHVIGAGGGSIATIDRAGALKVGPGSAGAKPGPAGYGHGGKEATISDANIVLHRLNPVSILNGKMPVDEEASEKVISELSDKLGLSMVECANGIIRIATANMARAIRAVSIEKGHALEDFVLMAFGGAGPLHASHVAQEAGISKVLIPNSPGTMCAQGVLMSDISRDYVHSVVRNLDGEGWATIMVDRDRLISEGTSWLKNENIPDDLTSYVTTIEARYQGQNHEIPVRIKGASISDFEEAFLKNHKATYGYVIEDRTIELVNLRVTMIGANGQRPKAYPKVEGTLSEAIIEHRKVYLDERTGWQNMAVYDRTKIPTGVQISGPAVIEELSSTTLILKGHTAIQDQHRNLLISLKG